MTSGWTTDIFKNSSETIALNTDNENIVSNRIMKVLLARWIVFRTFIQEAKNLNGGVLHDNIRRDWLFFQILPLVRVHDRNPFSALIHTCLVGVDIDVLTSLLEDFEPAEVLGPPFKAAVDPFFYVFDEAQVADKQYMDAFCDANGKTRRPVLRPIIRYLAKSSTPLIRVIVSGTGFSLESFKTAPTSGVGKDSSMLWGIVDKTGDFMDKDRQLEYLTRYLPPSFLASKSGESLKFRMHEWLRGRYVVAIAWR